MRYYVAILEDPRRWPEILAKMSASLNNLTKYNSIS